VIRFNRPEMMNAFDMETVEELIKAINNIRNDDHKKGLIITETGKAFCVGVDYDHKRDKCGSGNRIPKRGRQNYRIRRCEVFSIFRQNRISVRYGRDVFFAKTR